MSGYVRSGFDFRAGRQENLLHELPFDLFTRLIVLGVESGAQHDGKRRSGGKVLRRQHSCGAEQGGNNPRPKHKGDGKKGSKTMVRPERFELPT